MARVNQTVCDRCGLPVEDGTLRGLPGKIKRFDKDYHGTEVDLCAKCATALKEWLENPNGAPIGYMFKKRPCPHNVPCAEPWGCSGQELVPIVAASESYPHVRRED